MALAPDPVHPSVGGALVRGVERRAAQRLALFGGVAASPSAVVVREGDERDRTLVAALADRDGGRRVPAAPLLIAEVGGIAVAAIGVLDRRVVVDPAGGATGAVALHAAVDRLQAVAAEQRGPARRRRTAARVRRATGRGEATGAGLAPTA